MTKKMNRAQIKYFEQRMKELKSLKETELEREEGRKINALIPVGVRALNYMRTHKKIAAQQLFDKAVETLGSDCWGDRYIALSYMSDRDSSRKPQFIRDIEKARDEEIDEIHKEYNDKWNVLDAKFTELMDRFYLSDCPDCAALMEELRNLSL